MANLSEPVFQRGSPLPGGELTELVCFHDGSNCGYGSGLWGVWTKGPKEEIQERRAKFLYAKARTAKRTIVDQELASLHQAVLLSRVFIKVFPSLRRVFYLGDSEVSHKQICSINSPKDTWTLNRTRDVITAAKEINLQGLEVKFFHVKSEDNLADRISKPVDDAQSFVHSSTWKNGFKWMELSPEQWPVDQVMTPNLTSGLIVVVKPEAGIGSPDPPLNSSSCLPEEHEVSFSPAEAEEAACQGGHQGGLQVERGMKVKEVLATANQSGQQRSAVAEVQNVPIFNGLLQRVSRLRVATRAIARILKMAKEKSFKGIKTTPTAEEEQEGWLVLVRDQQKVMDEKRILEEKYQSFVENEIRFSRQRWDITTHLDLFNVDKLPVVDIDSRLGELLLSNAHRPPSGPCRTRSHTIYYLRSSTTASLLAGPVEKRLTQLMAKCVACRKRKIAVKAGDLTSFSPQMKHDRFKAVHPRPFSKIACDTLGPVKVALDTSGVGTRRVARYAEHHVLVVACIAGSGAARYIQIPSTSADGFAMGLHRLVAYTGYPPTHVFTDFGSGLVSAGKKEKERAGKKIEIEDDKDGESVIPKVLTDRYPAIQFECAKSSEQFKNGKAESLCKAWKLYVKDVMYLKPNASLPEFTVLGLDLLCEEASRVVNSRPTAYLGSQDLVISPNHFLLAGFSQNVWGSAGELPTKYLHLQQYRERMFEVLQNMMVNSDFTPRKWTKDERMAKVGDVCYITRQKNKVSYILEYGVILEIQDNGRNLKMRVCRQGGKNVREIEVSSRLVHLLFRPTA